MDFGAFFGPAVVAAGVSGLISLVSLFLSHRAAERLHTKKLAFDREQGERMADANIELADRRFKAEQDLAERKFTFDQQMAKQRFRYERNLHDHEKRVLLVEQAITAFREAGDILKDVQAPNILLFMYDTMNRKDHKAEVAETITEDRHGKAYIYRLVVKHLQNGNAIFLRLQSLQYTFPAHFGEEARKAFHTVFAEHNNLRGAAMTLIDLIDKGYADDVAGNEVFDRMAQPFLETLGWSTRLGPGKANQRVEDAISSIEAICRPFLTYAVPE